MNWGHKITIVIVVFLISMTGMVFLASKQTNEMIDEKYYEKELVYQQLINAKENLQLLNTSSLVQQDASYLKIQIPAAARNNIENGMINFLRNDDKLGDLQLKLSIDANGVQQIEKSKLRKGWYKFRIRWKSNGKEYYNEKNLEITG